MQTKSWSELFAAYFHTLSANEINLWNEELADRMSRLEADEVAKAVKTMAERQRQGDLKIHRPTLNTLISQIIKSRYNARQDEVVPDGKCGLCGNTGWIPYIACYDYKTNERTLGIRDAPHPGKSECDEAVPCPCNRGQKVLIACYAPDKHERMRRWAEEVRQWKQSRPETAIADPAGDGPDGDELPF